MSTVKPGSARWRELVQQGIVKDAQRNWFLGKAALEIAPMGEDHGHNGRDELLDLYADEIGVKASSLHVYRTVANAWLPEGNRLPSASWKVHQMLMARPELIKPGMTVTQAHRALGQSTAGRTGPRSTPEDRARQVGEFLGDPEVRRLVTADIVARSVAEAGGRIPTLEEVNANRYPPELVAVEGAIADQDRWARSVTVIKRELDTLAALGPVGEDSMRAADLREIQLAALDIISTKVHS